VLNASINHEAIAKM